MPLCQPSGWHSPQDICNKVTIWRQNESQKTVFRVKAEPTSTENMPVEAARMPKEGPVGKKARVGASRPFQAIHAPLKRKSQKRFGRITTKPADATNKPPSFPIAQVAPHIGADSRRPKTEWKSPNLICRRITNPSNIQSPSRTYDMICRLMVVYKPPQSINAHLRLMRLAHRNIAIRYRLMELFSAKFARRVFRLPKKKRRRRQGLIAGAFAFRRASFPVPWQ